MAEPGVGFCKIALEVLKETERKFFDYYWNLFKREFGDVIEAMLGAAEGIRANTLLMDGLGEEVTIGEAVRRAKESGIPVEYTYRLWIRRAKEWFVPIIVIKVNPDDTVEDVINRLRDKINEAVTDAFAKWVAKRVDMEKFERLLTLWQAYDVVCEH